MLDGEDIWNVILSEGVRLAVRKIETLFSSEQNRTPDEWVDEATDNEDTEYTSFTEGLFEFKLSAVPAEIEGTEITYQIECIVNNSQDNEINPHSLYLLASNAKNIEDVYDYKELTLENIDSWSETTITDYLTIPQSVDIIFLAILTGEETTQYIVTNPVNYPSEIDTSSSSIDFNVSVYAAEYEDEIEYHADYHISNQQPIDFDNLSINIMIFNTNDEIYHEEILPIGCIEGGNERRIATSFILPNNCELYLYSTLLGDGSVITITTQILASSE